MSLKDDFLEALRSVKRDFSRDSYDSGSEQYEETGQEAVPLPDVAAAPAKETASAAPDLGGLDYTGGERQSIMDNFQPELHKPAEPDGPAPAEQAADQTDGLDQEDLSAAAFWEEDGEEGAADAEEAQGEDALPVLDDILSADGFGFQEDGDGSEFDGRFSLDTFDQEDSLGDERTIISKNTIIRGAIQTDDSVRMFGQVMGDIDCRSNILVAGKVRGNTSAANAYVINAQVDGNLLCDDVINVTDDAWILGNIRAQQADIDGKIKGNIEIRHSISVGSNSSIIGNISTDELEIRRGAFVNGQIMMYSPSRDVIDRFDRFDQ